jgi:hypothetical protein
MTKSLNLKEAEKKIFRLATFQDGILEIYLGLFFTLMSIYSLTRDLFGPVINAVFILGLLLLMMGGVWIAKRRITLPRIGMVKFGKQTRRNIKISHLIIWILVIATISLWLASAKNWISEPVYKNLPQWITDFDVDLIFAVVMVAVFSQAAYVIGLSRFYLYGILLGVGNFVSAAFLVYEDVKFQWPVAIAGGTIMLVGGWVFAKFLRDYTISTEEIVNAG